MKKLAILILAILLLVSTYLFVKQRYGVNNKDMKSYTAENTDVKNEEATDLNEYIPTYNFPLTSGVYDNLPKDSDKLIIITIENPFEIDVNAKLTQQIPDGISIIDSAGGLFLDDSLIWEMPMKSKGFHAIRVKINISGNPGDKIMLKGAKLEYTNETGGDTYTSKDVEIVK